MQGDDAFALAMAYTKQTAQGMGAVKGKNCQIISESKDADGNTIIVFGWRQDDGTEKTLPVLVKKGERGEQGDKGDKGDQGIQGVSPIITQEENGTEFKLNIIDINGKQTTSNLKGPQGIQGIQGERGEKGDTGEQGLQGIQGIKGDKGDDGYPFLIYRQYDTIAEFTPDDFPEIGLMFMVMTFIEDKGYPIYRYIAEGEPPYSLVTHMNSEGVKGEKGDKGDQGEQGIQGEPGKDGLDGTTFTPEIGTVTTVEHDKTAQASVRIDAESKKAVFDFSIPKGRDGNGFSAYELAVKQGFVGSEAEWLKSLHGENGLDAPQIDDTQATPDNPYSGKKVEDLLKDYQTTDDFKKAIGYTDISELGADVTEAIKKVNDSLDSKVSKLEYAELKILGWNAPKDFVIQNEVSGNQFIQKVGRVDLGNLNWRYNHHTTNYFEAVISDIYKQPIQHMGEVYIFGTNYTVNESNYVGDWSDKQIAAQDNQIFITDSNYTYETAFRSGVSGQYLYYRLETPVIKQIDENIELLRYSEVLTIDNVTVPETPCVQVDFGAISELFPALAGKHLVGCILEDVSSSGNSPIPYLYRDGRLYARFVNAESINSFSVRILYTD